MGRTSAPRRRVDVLSTVTRRWSRRGREVLLGKQDLPESATAPAAAGLHCRWTLLQSVARMPCLATRGSST